MKEILRELLSEAEFRSLLNDIQFGRISCITCVEMMEDEKEIVEKEKGQSDV